MIVWKFDLQLPMQSISITTKVVSSNPTLVEVHSMQQYVFISDLRQVSGFLRVHPPIKITTAIYLNYCCKFLKTIIPTVKLKQWITITDCKSENQLACRLVWLQQERNPTTSRVSKIQTDYYKINCSLIYYKPMIEVCRRKILWYTCTKRVNKIQTYL